MKTSAVPALPYRDARPYTRWWWFSGEIRESDVRAQLDWLERSGFGGVEIAWVYPQPGSPPGPAFLSPEWSAIVAFAKRHADAIGLGCDFTFGTLWPFGGSFVSEADAARTFHGPSPQRLGRSWEIPHAEPGRILDHLNRDALRRYADRMGRALAAALEGSPSALFCDSWEVEGDDLWTEDFEDRFRARFRYDVVPYMDRLDTHEDVRYDYRALLADLVLDEFYRPFTDICHDLGAVSRVQCHGAPTDLLAAYAAADVPETEAVLFDPPFARLAASAAALSGRPVVSAEAFTCLYGWVPYPGPGPHQGDEVAADLKLVADSLFASGVNAIVWHGMPFRAAGRDDRFYASVHVGAHSGFADDLPALNDYLRCVGAQMRRGEPCADLAVYLPIEDDRMRGELPERLRRPSARHYWELQHERIPCELAGYRPLWVSAPFLAGAEVFRGRLQCGPTTFRALYIDAAWLDSDALAEVLRLARAGLPVCLKQRPRAPGHLPPASFERDLDRLVALPHVAGDLAGLDIGPPFLEGADPPEHWCRREGDDLLVFFAHPAGKEVTYPLRHGQALSATAVKWAGRLRCSGCDAELELDFAPGESVLARVAPSGRVGFERCALECAPRPSGGDIAVARRPGRMC